MRTVVAVVMFALLTAAAWLLLGRGDTPPISAGNAASANRAAPTAASVTGSVDVTAASTAPSAAAAAADADAVKRIEARPQFEGPSGEVCVVHGVTKEPVADATVTFFPPEFDWHRMSAELRELMAKDNEAFQARISLAVTTDAMGRCRVPLGKQGTQAKATKGDLWGYAFVRPDVSQVTMLTVLPDRTLHVLVLAATGSPMPGAIVNLRPKDAAGPAVAIGTTDAAGRVAVRHTQRFALPDAPAIFAVTATYPGGETQPEDVDVLAPPSEVVLRLLAGGTVAVALRDADGKPIDPTYLEGPNAQLVTWGAMPTREEELRAFNRVQGEAPIDEHGVARFGTVGFGAFVKAFASWQLQSAAAPGPTLASPHVDLVIAEAPDDVVLLGNLVDAERRPVKNAGFQVNCRYRNGMSGPAGRTDAEGRFRVKVGRARAGVVTVSFDVASPGAQADALAVELPPRELPAGRHELGELVVRAHGVLVQGKVVGDGTAEQRQVQLLVERKVGDDWAQEFNVHPQWGEDASFTMRSSIAKGTPIRLVVHANGFLPVAPHECSAGDTGIELALQRGGEVEATFLVDADVPLDRMGYRLRRTDPGSKDAGDGRQDRTTMFQRHGQAKDGRLQRQWSGLQSGRYCLQVVCAGITEPIVAIDAITVAGGLCADPRLVDIDLRGRVRTIEVRATGADGAPIVSAESFVVIRSAGDEWSGFHLGAGVARLATPATVDLVVLAKGHKAAFVDGVAESRTIALEAAGEVRLVCQFPSPLPEGVQFKVLLRPKLAVTRQGRLLLENGGAMPLERLFADDAIVDGEGRCVLPLRFPGVCGVEGQVLAGARNSGIYVRDFEPKEITLPAPAEVVVRVGQKGLDQALEPSRR